MTDAGDRREPGKKEESVVLAAAMLATVVVTLDVSVVNIAIPQFERTFGIAIDAAQWVLNVYTLVFASLLLNAGALVDRWGTRRTFIAGFAVFVAASLACGVAPNWPVLLTARGCQGVGAALLVPSALAMIQQGVPEPTARARAIGWWAASGSAALAAGPVVGRRAGGLGGLAKHLPDQSADRHRRDLAGGTIPAGAARQGWDAPGHRRSDVGDGDAGLPRAGRERRRSGRADRRYRPGDYGCRFGERADVG